MAITRASGNELKVNVCNALGIDPHKVRRVVLDLSVDNPVVAYVEMYVDTKMIDIKWDFDNVVTVTLEEQG